MGVYLRQERLRANLSLTDVAWRTGIKLYRLQQVERGCDTLGPHHWDALQRVVPTLDPKVLRALLAAQNRPRRYQRWRRFWRCHAGTVLLVVASYIAGGFAILLWVGPRGAERVLATAVAHVLVALIAHVNDARERLFL